MVNNRTRTYRPAISALLKSRIVHIIPRIKYLLVVQYIYIHPDNASHNRNNNVHRASFVHRRSANACASFAHVSGNMLDLIYRPIICGYL